MNQIALFITSNNRFFDPLNGKNVNSIKIR